ncbi:uncharacterized protein LOC122570552 isoform X1 [Bombus pyrosoma]|uniref:uncharacterized protein LOC122570552 isoform X1 n=2 Tax=Bombus pyrosoma TaxID=396416 RepID=UPI001CB8CBE5|nr:uncharacterized protein LOC122570552 isoform X1 [Bombus pyrosoma]
MDPENTRKETIVKVTDWLRGIWEMRRQTGPVQQWIDSIPSPIKSNFSMKNDNQGESSSKKPNISLALTEPKDIPYSMRTKQLTMTVSAPINVPNTTSNNTTGLPSSLPHKLVRDPSLQSDSSHCSSVESLLELRKADPEAILLGLGFGGCSSSPQENGSFSRIPKRFLQPSKLKGIAINDFMKQQQETSESFDSVSLGYRGLTGSPYVAPSEIVQKIMQRLREHESHEHDPYAVYNSYEQYSPLHCGGTLSVLSPDSRQFLERPRSKSPDMRNKRMIIGQKSFAFGHDGDLIEIDPSNEKKLFESIPSDDSKAVENSGIFNDLADNNNEVYEQTPIQKKILPKRLFFNDNTELNDTDVSLSVKVFEESEDQQNENLNKNTDYKDDIFPNTVSENVSDIRRASDGFYDMKDRKISIVNKRRHSDGFVQTTEHVDDTVLTRRRKTLKRQSRISDTDVANYCNINFSKSDTAQCLGMNCNTNKNLHEVCNQESISTKFSRLKNKTKDYDVNECGEKLLEGMYKSAEDSLSKNKQENKNEYYVEETKPVEQVCIDKGEKTTCCCHSGTKKYWKKMEKIIQENKNLETMVTKSRREMAEIREMLNNVLSVRLEPGF